MSNDVVSGIVLTALVGVGAAPFAWLLIVRWLFRARRTVVLVVRLAGERAPYPRRPLTGLLIASPDRVVWRGFLGAPRLDLGPTGLRALHQRPGAASGRRGDGPPIACQDGQGTGVTLWAYHRHVHRIMAVLGDRALPAAPEAPVVQARSGDWVPALPLVLLSAGVLAALPLLDEAAATPDPLQGMLQQEAGVPALALIGLGGCLLVLRLRVRWRMRPPALRPGRAPAPDPGAAGPAVPTPASWRQVSQAVKRLAVVEGWRTWTGAGTVPARRWRPPAQVVGAALLVAVAVGFFAVVLYPARASYSTLWDGGPTFEARATVVQATRPTQWVPVTNVVVEFGPPGSRLTATLPMRSAPDDGVVVIPVEYVFGDPPRAWAVEGDARRAGAAAGAAVATWAGGGAWWALAPLHRLRHAQRRAMAAGPVQIVHYVVASAPAGTCRLILFGPHELSTPQFSLDLPDREVRTVPAAGRVEVHGPLEEGWASVLFLRGRRVRTTGHLVPITAEELLRMLRRR